MLDSAPAKERLFLSLGAISGFLGVAAGAFGAHALKAHLTPDLLAVFETGTRYQLVHAIALIVAGLVTQRRHGRAAPAAGWLFLLGTVFFSGSLYVLALTGVRAWGAVTPLGGVMWLLGWALLAFAGGRARE
ncbi:DUF423 domain-containing protein, partial [bacterium]|nr:DUF423 domain-containing protein [bacterium]